jgi:hypothetical protein
MAYKGYRGLRPFDNHKTDASGFASRSMKGHQPNIGRAAIEVLNSISNASSLSVPQDSDGLTWDNLNKSEQCWHFIGRTKDGAGKFCGRPIIQGKIKCREHLTK